jgi:hypothetical protein
MRRCKDKQSFGNYQEKEKEKLGAELGKLFF